MERRTGSYWLFVLLAGPIGGLVAGAFWTIVMALSMQQSIWRVFFSGGFMFTVTMMVAFTAMFAWMFRPVRREVSAGDAGTAHDSLLPTATKLKFRTLEQAEGYYRFEPPGGLIKPKCSQVEVWIDPGQMIVVGPDVHVKRLVKRIRAAGK